MISFFASVGVGTPDVATVQTPGRKERTKILKKRRTLLDLTTVVPNKYVIKIFALISEVLVNAVLLTF